MGHQVHYSNSTYIGVLGPKRLLQLLGTRLSNSVPNSVLYAILTSGAVLYMTNPPTPVSEDTIMVVYDEDVSRMDLYQQTRTQSSYYPLTDGGKAAFEELEFKLSYGGLVVSDGTDNCTDIFMTAYKPESSKRIVYDECYVYSGDGRVYRYDITEESDCMFEVTSHILSGDVLRSFTMDLMSGGIVSKTVKISQ